MKELRTIQTELKAPKNLYNNFGKYKYRNLESILESVKPLLAKNKCTLVIHDEIEQIGDRVYVKAIATIKNEAGEEVQATACAREPETKKGMDDSQITGTASSYARKYCLNGLFLIDDTKDADSNEYHEEVENSPEPKATATQIKIIKEHYQEEELLKKMLEYYKVAKVEDLTLSVASGLCKKIKEGGK